MGWTCTVLAGPKGKPTCKALGFVNGAAIGSIAGAGKPAPVWWPDGKGTAITIDGFKDLNVQRGSGAHVAAFMQKRMGTEAVLLTLDGDVFRATSLHSKVYSSTAASGCDGVTQVGYGQRKGSYDSIALRWRGTPDSVQELVAPDGKSESTAYAVDGATIVGLWGRTGGQQACMWREGTPNDLHPRDAIASELYGVCGDIQVGAAWTKAGARATLWKGSAASAIDLTPPAATGGTARACAAGLQVGWAVYGEPSEGITHALVWRGTAASAIDLHELVPAPYNTSAAWGLFVDGERVRVAGEVTQIENGVSRGARAAIWDGSLRG